jgi:pyruvate,water dikinase
MHKMKLSSACRATVALAFAGLSACGSEADHNLDDRGFQLVLMADAGLPSRYRVVLAKPDSSVGAVSCPGGGDRQFRCTARGVAIESLEAGSTLTIKPSGYEFVSLPVTAEQIAEGRMQVTLAPLATFEASDAYRTGFDREGGADAFAALAVETQTEFGPARSVKFYVSGFGQTPQVYFQNTRRYPLHYDFARFVLGVGASRPIFEQNTYHGENRTALAGTLIYYPELELPRASSALTAPIALEFFPSDDLTPAQAMNAHRLIEERLLWLGLDGSDERLLYVPAGSAQEAQLAEAEADFAAQDALSARVSELYAGVEQQILNPGVAYGTLRLVTPEELSDMVVSFRDLLVLTRLPNDLPLVGGTITEELQTPLAHVNVAARARGTPNLSLRGAASDPRIVPFLDQLVRFEVTAEGFSLRAATLSEAQAYWDSRAGDPLVPEADEDFSGLPDFDELGFADSIRVGVKAANLSELRHLLGDTAPAGFAVPFSAYHAYMSQNRVTTALCGAARADCEEEGRSEAICAAAETRCAASAAANDNFYGLLERLLVDAELPTDTALRDASLNTLRYLVHNGTVDPDFALSLDARVMEIFGERKVRLRSSTNAEDLPNFTGAGLYESLSAFASGDRRASARIREVWASVFSFPAFEERTLWNVEHRAVRMGVAVDEAIDDEVANGVLITRNLANPGSEGLYVNVQQGEVEVTNPENGAVPEIFSIVPAPGGGVQVVRQRFSSLSPDVPLLEDDEVNALAEAADRVHAHFAPLYGGAGGTFALDLEFKFHGPSRKLVIKQARPYVTALSP